MLSIKLLLMGLSLLSAFVPIGFILRDLTSSGSVDISCQFRCQNSCSSMCVTVTPFFPNSFFKAITWLSKWRHVSERVTWGWVSDVMILLPWLLLLQLHTCPSTISVKLEICESRDGLRVRWEAVSHVTGTIWGSSNRSGNFHDCFWRAYLGCEGGSE